MSTVCPAGETQRCMKCRDESELYCDLTGHYVNCQEKVSHFTTYA